MEHKAEVAASQSWKGGGRSIPKAAKRLASGQAPLVLGITSTLVYLASALMAYFATYTPGIGREKLTLMLVGLLLPLALAVLVRRRVETAVGVLGVALALACALVGASMLTVAGSDKGAIAGSVGVVAPLAACGVVWAIARHNRRLLWVLGASIAVAVICLLLSGENSAILGLIVGVVLSAGIFWRCRLAERSPWLRLIDLSTLTLLMLAVGVYLALILTPDSAAPLRAMLPAYYAQRFALWREAPAIIQDYLYTGSGLGASPMVLSSYLFLIHVPYYYHIHNLFLQVGIEQGMPGIIGLTGMFVAAFWSMGIAIRRAHPFLALYAAAVLGSLLSLFVSGMFESDVYAGAWIVSMFLPFGFAWVIGQHDVALASGQRYASEPQLAGGRHFTHEPPPSARRLRPGDIVVSSLPVVALLVLLAWPGANAQWLANRGAVAQTSTELFHFRFPLNKIQDEVRRNPEINLDPAIAYYQAALERNPANVTALRRLAQIEISRGDDESALRKLELAYQRAPEQRATRQMLGEVYIALGDSERGRALWSTVENGASQLQARLWWRQFIGDNDTAQRMADILAQLG